MRKIALALGLITAALVAGPQGHAQGDPDPAETRPDMVAWQLFIEAIKPSGATPTFDGWATDQDTFHEPPIWPSHPATHKLGPTNLGTGRLAVQALLAIAPRRGPAPSAEAVGPTACGPGGANLRQVSMPNGSTAALCIGELVHRNRATFDYIVHENLYTQDGLRAAYGKTVSFPTNSIEVKVDWIKVDAGFTQWSGVSTADAASEYYVEKGDDGADYALAGMHVISKEVPTWTWATFEAGKNPGRCDLIGCHDDFGAEPATMPPNPIPSSGYPACVKTAALSGLLHQAGLPAVWEKYCLKGSQMDFATTTGVVTIDGNSVIEQINAGVPVNQASCITCHATSAFGANGNALQIGLSQNLSGPPSTAWFDQGAASYAQADFVWAIPLCAIPHGQTKSPCG